MALRWHPVDRMPAAPLPPDEQERLEELHRLGLLDTAPEAAFDDLTLLASTICDVPMALITLIDADRQWFKSSIGIGVAQTPRDQAFCAYAIHETGLMEVPDAREDPRFSDNPLVRGEPHIRFYAGVPLEVGNGQKIGTLCVLDSQPRELTPVQRNALEAIARQVRRNLQYRQLRYLTQTFVGHAPAYVALKDSEARFAFVNAAWRETLAAYGDPVGRTSHEWVPDDEMAESADELDRMAVLENTVSLSTGETPFGLPGRRWLVSRFPVQMISGSAGLGIIAIDTSEALEAEERLREAERRLEHAQRLDSIGMVASTVAHEFNNVLMGISPYAQVLERSAAEGSREQKAGAAISEAVRRGAGLVQQILRYGRPVQPALRRLDLRDWLVESASLFEAMAGAAIDLEVSVPSSSVDVDADPDHLHQVLANLIANARDAMEGKGRIELQLTTATELAEISVSDSGPGIEQEVMERIFEPLFTTKRKGTGLGLAVCRQIVEAHHGSLGVESRTGEGTTFHLRLPKPSAGAVDAGPPDMPP